MAKQTTIGGLRIEADNDGFGMSHVSITKGRYWSSLSALEDNGFLLDDKCEGELPIPAAVIEKISAWAEANGF
jgi:hypothetical protein